MEYEGQQRLPHQHHIGKADSQLGDTLLPLADGGGYDRDFDADCDWSEALAGEPGEFVVIVRRAKDKYFLGAATNEEARKVDVKLDFLEKGRVYRALIYADGEGADWELNPTAYEIIEKLVTADDTLTVSMARSHQLYPCLT